MSFWDWFLNALRRAERCPPKLSAVIAPVAIATLDRPQTAPDVPHEEFHEHEKGWWKPVEGAFTEPAPLTRPNLSEAGLALEEKLESFLADQDLQLPQLPLAADRVVRCLRNPHFDTKAVAHEIKNDQAIAAATLRAANSAFYGAGEPVTKLPAAVVRLGAAALRSLMMRESMRTAMLYSKGPDQELAVALWNRSSASACIMSGLSRLTGLDPEEGCMMGLLHDIGSLVVLRGVVELKSTTDQDVSPKEFEYVCHAYHERFGRAIAQAWRLPSKLESLIADHHAPPQPDDPFRVERLSLELTDMIASMLGYSPPVPYDLLASRAATELGLSDSSKLRKFLDQLPAKITADAG